MTACRTQSLDPASFGRFPAWRLLDDLRLRRSCRSLAPYHVNSVSHGELPPEAADVGDEAAGGFVRQCRPPKQSVYPALHPLTTSSPARTSSQMRTPHRAVEPLKKSQVEREGAVEGAVFSSTARFSSTPRARSATQCARRRPHYPPSSLVPALLASWRFSLLSSCPRDRCAYCPDTSWTHGRIMNRQGARVAREPEEREVE